MADNNAAVLTQHAKVLIVDYKKADAERLADILKKLWPCANVTVLRSCQQFTYLKQKERFSAAFISSGHAGIHLVRKLQLFAPKCNIIFVEDNKDFAYEGILTRPSGYLLKPVTAESVRIELEHLRYPLLSETAPVLKVQTFGNFVVYNEEGKPLHFTRAISREILAYLINQRGFPVTGRDIAADVLEESDYTEAVSKKISQYVADLIKDMKKEGYDDVVVKQNRQLFIDKNAVDCDLYHYLNGDPEAVQSYHGEYMIDYSWAESSSLGE